MDENNAQTRTVGPLPVLFVGIGPCAEKTLGEFSRVAKRVAGPIQGPIGLVLSNVSGDEVFTADWTWVSDFEVPDLRPVRDGSESVGPDDKRLLATLSSLVRRLRSKEPTSDPRSPGRVRMSSYVIIDLSVGESVAAGLRLMRALRRADPAQDMTVVGLTARTATPGSEVDGIWFDAWKRLLEHLQEEAIAQKIYMLDGCNASSTWLERPEQLHRLGAEFLLYHGLVCRSALRQYERGRVSPKENVLSVCGSFGVREIPVDPAGLAERVATRLAHDDLRDLYRGTLSEARRQDIDKQAKHLAESIAGIYDKASQAKPSAPGETPQASGPFAVRNAQVLGEIGKTITQVCARDPLLSLCHLLKCLRPRLRCLLTRHRLLDRATTRRHVTETLRRQDEKTYGPMRVWLSNPETRWADRFTPEHGAPSHVAVSQPASKKGYVLGLMLLMLGLISIPAALYYQERVFAIGGGLLALAASALMTFPTAWSRCRRHTVPEGQGPVESVRPVVYRRRASGAMRAMAGVLAIAGGAAMTWSLWPGAWTSAMALQAGASVLIAVAGLTLLFACPVRTHPDQASKVEVPDHLNPPRWDCRALGLLCLALAWVVLCLQANPPSRVDTAVQWGCQLGGLLLTAVGVGLALFPRIGFARFIDRVPKVPEPISGGVGSPGEEETLYREVSAMTLWFERLTLEPEECLLRSKAAETQQRRETLLDFFAPDWDRQLADVFRKTLTFKSIHSVNAMALQPTLWAQCIVKQLQNPKAQYADLSSLFALGAVQAWVDSHSLPELMAFLRLDVARFGQRVARLVSPHWPATRVEPEMSVSTLVVGKALWDTLAPLAQLDGAPAMMRLDYGAETDGVLAIRLVQGLSRGWRGFPAIPGQVSE